MKNLKLIKSVYLLIVIACFYGCTSDTIIETEENAISQSKALELSTEKGMSVLITFNEGITEEAKDKFRKFYQEVKVLTAWEPCEEDERSEVWTVSCSVEGYQCRQGNPPTKPDKPVPGQTERMLPNADCSDL